MEMEGSRIHLATALAIVKIVDTRGNSDCAGNGVGVTEPESEYNGIWNGRGTDENDGHSCFDEKSSPERHAREGTALENADAASNELKGCQFADGPPAWPCLARTTAMEYAST